MTRSVLYISYDGMLEPLSRSQVLLYLEHLNCDRPIHLLSFEKLEDLLEIRCPTRCDRRVPARFSINPQQMGVA